jgi:hypothetical protein
MIVGIPAFCVFLATVSRPVVHPLEQFERRQGAGAAPPFTPVREH